MVTMVFSIKNDQNEHFFGQFLQVIFLISVSVSRAEFRWRKIFEFEIGLCISSSKQFIILPSKSTVPDFNTINFGAGVMVVFIRCACSVALSTDAWSTSKII